VAEDEPQVAPKEAFFKFEATTLFVNAPLPCVIGNLLLAFCENEIRSTILKVNREMYAVKVDVFVGTAVTTVKARV
jgi:hypothetical protein